MNLFDRDDTKQAKSLIFNVFFQVEEVPKVQKKKTKRDVEMLLEPIINSNYKFT